MVAENEYAIAEIDERQYERGAMLVIPKQHRESVLDIEPGEMSGVYRLVQEVARAATRAFGAQGMNIFQNSGAKAGQTEPHFHVHIVPRYGDNDPHKIFLQDDFETISMGEQRAIADLIRREL